MPAANLGYSLGPRLEFEFTELLVISTHLKRSLNDCIGITYLDSPLIRAVLVQDGKVHENNLQMACVVNVEHPAEDERVAGYLKKVSGQR